MKTAFTTLLLTAAFFCSNKLAAQNEIFGRTFTNHTEAGGMFGNVDYAINPYTTPRTYDRQHKSNLTIQTFNGIQLTSRLATGLTVGVDWYNDALITPVAAGARFDLFSRNNARLFGTLDAGYGFTWFHKNLNDNRLEGGMMLNPGIGWRLGKPGNAGFTIAVTYKRQEAMLKMPTSPSIPKQEESRTYNRLAIRLGIVF